MTQKQSNEIKVIRIWRKTGFKSMSRRYSTAIESPFPVNKNNALTEIITSSLKFIEVKGNNFITLYWHKRFHIK